jgi:hypothetical protein
MDFKKERAERGGTPNLFSSDDAQRFFIQHVAPPQYLIQHPRHRDLLFRGTFSQLNTTSKQNRKKKGSHRPPGSYSVPAMGEISEWILSMPSNDLSGGGLTILASTCASTLPKKRV